MSRDLHAADFSDETLTKLDLYKRYVQAWLPIAIHAPISANRTINICDFFAGPGADTAGVPGSPRILLEEIGIYTQSIQARQRRVRIYFNEKSKKKFRKLTKTIAQFSSDEVPWEIIPTNRPFAEAFTELLPALERGINLIFLDQSGVKEITSEIFRQMTRLQRTDFMFFIASSYISRFSKLEEFRDFSGIPRDKITRANYYNVHREVKEFYKQLAPPGYFLCQFSIKKFSNIYGLIFGSHHPKGALKFLEAAWKHDPERGEANFDIDREDLNASQRDLFKNNTRASKLDAFEAELERAIRSGQISSDKEVVIFALQSGMLPRHVKHTLDKLRDDGVIACNERLRLSDKAFSEPRSFNLIEAHRVQPH